MSTASELLAIAARELGTKEVPRNSNNVKYNTWYHGKEVSGPEFQWCVIFVQWVFDQAGVSLPVRTHSSGALMRAAQAAGCWVEKDFRPGDVPIFDFPGGADTDHAGIIESVGTNGTVTIEGNTGNSDPVDGGRVMRCERPFSVIRGAVRPNFDPPNRRDLIEIRVSGSIVSVQQTAHLVSGSVNAQSCHFAFDPSWDGFTKSAVFRVGARTITTLLDAEGCCSLPWEILTKDNVGLKVEVAAYGVCGNSEVLTPVWDTIGTVRNGTQPGYDALTPSAVSHAKIETSVAEIDETVDAYTGKMTALKKRADTVSELAVTGTTQTELCAENAEKAAAMVQTALSGVQAAIRRIPKGKTPVINSIVTGGAAAALSAEMGKRLAERKPRNLMDNSYLVRPVNQRGEKRYPAGSTRYTIDRWRAVAGIAVSINTGFVRIENTYSGTNGFTQWVAEENAPKAGDTITLACEDVKGNIYVGSKALPESGTVTVCYLGSSAVGSLQIRMPDDTYPDVRVTVMLRGNQFVDLKWIALYEGKYTADLPPLYQPKDYEAELKECQRYFRRLNTRGADNAFLFAAHSTGPASAKGMLELSTAMRTVPAVIWAGNAPIAAVPGAAEITEISVADETGDLDRLWLNVTTAGELVAGERYEIRSSGTLDLDANL